MGLERWDITAANLSAMDQAWRFSSYREPNLQPVIMVDLGDLQQK
jgi:hypothetical protein